MTTTPLGQTEITGAQSQAEVYLDRNMAVLEGGLGRVQSRSTSTAPGGEAEGDAYIVPTGSTWGAYAFSAGNIALYSGGGYIEVSAAVGHRVRVEDEGGAEAVYVGTPDVVWYGRGAITTQTTTYPAGAHEVILGDASGGAFTVTLPAAADAENLSYTVRNIGASGDVTVDGDGAETIDGAASATVSPGDALVVVSDGTEWWSVSAAGEGAALDVTDGSTTVSSTDKITFAGATVTDQGSGDALVTISAATGDPADLVATSTGASGTLSVDVSGLPAGDLEVSFWGRGDAAVAGVLVYLRLNSDTGNNYHCTVARFYANDTMDYSTSDGTNLTYLQIGAVPAATSTANYWGQVNHTIPSYKSTAAFKAGSGTGADFRDTTTANARAQIFSGLWLSTAAITTVSIVASSGNWVSGSTLRVRVKGVPNAPQLLVNAYRNAALSPTTSQAAIVWDTAPINVATVLNTSTGLFTAPSDGTYRFRAKAQAGSASTTGTLNLVLVDDPGGTPNELDIASVYHSSAGNGENTVHLDYTAILTAGDTLNVQAVSSVGGGLALQVGDEKRSNLQITRLA